MTLDKAIVFAIVQKCNMDTVSAYLELPPYQNALCHGAKTTLLNEKHLDLVPASAAVAAHSSAAALNSDLIGGPSSATTTAVHRHDSSSSITGGGGNDNENTQPPVQVAAVHHPPHHNKPPSSRISDYGELKFFEYSELPH